MAMANSFGQLSLGPKTPNLVVNGSSSASMPRDGSRPPLGGQSAQDSPKTDSNPDLGVKAPSLDGKSVESANALDEKESLRPEDSASVMAAAEDDDTSVRGSMIAGSRMGSDLAYRARHIALGDAVVPERRPTIPTTMAQSCAGIMTPQSLSSGQQGTTPSASLATDTLSMIYQQNPDDKLLDAMKSPRDRLFLLRLESQLIDFVTNSKEPYMDVREGPDRAPERSLNTFYRMLAHKLADYYHMTHTYEPSADGVRIYRTPFCRVPQSLAEAVAASNSNGDAPAPAILPRKIMKRGEDAETGQPTSSPSKAASVDSDSKDKDKAPGVKENRRTRSEREEAYKLARERIFGISAESETNDNDNAESRASSVSAKDKGNGGKRGRNGRQRRDSDGFDYRPSNYWSPYPQQPWPPQPGYMPVIPNNQFPPQASSGLYMASPAGSPWQHPNPTFYPMMPQGPGQYTSPQHGLGSPHHGHEQFQPLPTQQPRYPPENGGTSPLMGYGHPVPPSGHQSGYQPQPPLGGLHYPNRGPGSSPLLMPAGVPYAYGQLPANDPKDPNRQHPIPGSYNRMSGFNPQIKSFVPGGNRMGPGPGPSPMPPAPPFAAPGSQHSSPHPPSSNLAYSGGFQSPMPPSGPQYGNGLRQGPMGGTTIPPQQPPYPGPPHGPGTHPMHQSPMPHHRAPPPPQLHPPMAPQLPQPVMNHLPSHSPNLPNKPIPRAPAAMVGNRLSNFGHPASLPPKPATGV